MAIGGSAQVAFSSRNTLNRKRLHKQLAARRMLLEALEGRQLMAVGPQLLGIQPNEGTLLTEGQVRKVSPNELVFRFDDRVGLDPNTLGGIRLIRSGDDGEFERAAMATDLGSGGQTLVEFYATEPGQVGNGIQISFTAVNRTDSRAPVVRVNGRSVSVEVNSNRCWKHALMIWSEHSTNRSPPTQSPISSTHCDCAVRPRWALVEQSIQLRQ